MTELIFNECMEKAQAESSLAKPNSNDDMNIELSKEFLMKLQSNAYHEMFDVDVVDHIPKIILISSEKIEEVMAEVKTKTTMEGLAVIDKANYYSGITSITVNGKRDYELKGKFLDDLRKNASSGTNGEEAVEHIVYFLKIVDVISLPNVNYERLRLSIFPISLVGNASKWFDEFKGSITTWVDLELFTYDIKRTMDYEDYENRLNDEPEEPWSENEVPYEIGDHICEPFLFKNGKTKWPTLNSNEYGFCNGGELPGMKTFENFHELNYELLEKLQDYWWKVNDHEFSPFANRSNYIRGPHANYYSNFLDKMEHEDEERCELFDDQERPVCNIRRFEMIKYSFRDDEEYVAVKDNKYDDLTSTSEDACRTYQEIFRKMDEGWMITRAECREAEEKV
ncbi:hypothetical protein Tco_0271694 [Tanacetum coccineum]